MSSKSDKSSSTLNVEDYDHFGTLNKTSDELAATTKPTLTAYTETVANICRAFGVPSSALLQLPSSSSSSAVSDLCDADLRSINTVCPHIRDSLLPLPTEVYNPSKNDSHYMDVYSRLLKACLGTCSVCSGGNGMGGGNLDEDDVEPMFHGHCLGCLKAGQVGAFCPEHAKDHCETHQAAAQMIMKALDDAEEEGNEVSGVSDDAAQAHAAHSVMVYTHGGHLGKLGSSGTTSVVYCHICDVFAPLTTFTPDQGKIDPLSTNNAATAAAVASYKTDNLVSTLDTASVMNRLLLACHVYKSMTAVSTQKLNRYNRKGIYLFRPTLFPDDEDESNEQLEDNINETCTDVILGGCDGSEFLLYRSVPLGEDGDGAEDEARLKIAACVASESETKKEAKETASEKHVDPNDNDDEDENQSSSSKSSALFGLKGFLLVFSSEDDVQEKMKEFEGQLTFVEKMVYLPNEKLWCEAFVACNMKYCKADSSSNNSNGCVPVSLNANEDDLVADDEMELVSKVEWRQLPECLLSSSSSSQQSQGGIVSTPQQVQDDEGPVVLSGRALFDAELAEVAGCPHSDASRAMAFLSGMTTVAHVFAIAPKLAAKTASASQ